ncbi:MAG TPA: hypothetical protein DFR83_08010 [Deltaproteobacteria bacterium]|nr:hypothetical protein [Deltaproteobacteria bacterium]
MFSTALVLAGMLSTAHAYVDPKCASIAAAGPPAGYSEQDQQNYLLNYFAMATTLSPLHGPVPHKSGHGSIGIDLSAIPPLGCERRLVLNYTKTEDTNKAPVVPRPRMIFAFPQWGKWTPYGGFAYAPPIPIFDTQNVIVSVEAGMGRYFGKSNWAAGWRFHHTLMKSVAEIATPFEEGEEAFDDFYMGSTLGVDVLVSKDFDGLEPYLAVGMTDASTFFYIGDDAVVTNNTSPYFAPAVSLGLDIKKIKKLDTAVEFYAAPGVIYTGRLRLAYRW